MTIYLPIIFAVRTRNSRAVFHGFGVAVSCLLLTSLALAQANTFPSSGNVGIGTTTPDVPLMVQGAGSLLHLYQTVGGANQFILDSSFASGNSYAVNPFITGISNGGFEIRDITNGASRIVIQNSTGNVGIGTTNPGTKLDILNAGAGPVVRVGGIALGTSDDAGIDLYAINGANNPAYARIALGVNTASVGNETGYLGLSTINGGSLSEKLRILANGNVGIGTTAPGTKLQVNGSTNEGTLSGESWEAAGTFISNTGSNGVQLGGTTGGNAVIAPSGGNKDLIFSFWNGSSNVETMRLKGGNVAIGTSSTALGTLVVYTNPETQAGIVAAGGGSISSVGYGNFMSSDQGEGNRWRFGRDNVATGNFIFALNESKKVVIDTSGNVGIGTTSPTQALTILGNIQLLGGSRQILLGNGQGLVDDGSANLKLVTAYDVYFAPNGAEAMRIKSGGNVGIGTNSPGAKLDVAGNVNVQGNLTASGNIAATGTFSTSGAASFTNTGATTFSGPISSASGNLTVSSAGSSNSLLLNPSGGYVGIGTTNPQGTLHLQSTQQFYPQELIENIGNAGSGYLIFQKSRSGQTAITNGDGLGSIMFEGYSNGGYQQSAYIAAIADAAPSGSNVLSAFTFNSRNSNGTLTEKFRISSNGNVGIGTANPSYLLSVSGTIQAKEVLVQTGWSDYVFDPNYRLAPLSEVERQIKAQKHLPGIPSAQEVAEHGVKTGEMEAKLLAKVEELTLHAIEQEKRLDSQASQMASQTERIERLEKENAALRTTY